MNLKISSETVKDLVQTERFLETGERRRFVDDEKLHFCHFRVVFQLVERQIERKRTMVRASCEHPRRRANGQVRWVWLGSRCTCCHTLGSAFDWKIDYEPTDEMEKNI